MKNVIIFIAGALTGALVTKRLIEKKYKDLADEEINSVVETFKKRQKNEKNKNDKKPQTYNNKIDKLGYASTDIKKMEDSLLGETNKISSTVSPRIISMNEYGSMCDTDDWTMRSWMYWNNNILTDEDDEPILDYEQIIGTDALLSFDEEMGHVYVRNDELRCDYEILRSEKDYVK